MSKIIKRLVIQKKKKNSYWLIQSTSRTQAERKHINK